MFDFQELVQLIPIAVIISIIVFLVRFFGKAISDQVPFADDREWHEELSGIMFFSNHVLSPIILVGILYLRGFRFWLFPKEDLFIILISLVVFISLSVTNRKSIAFFIDNKFTEGNYLESLKKSFKNNSKIDFGDSMIYYRVLFFPIVSLATIYLLILFYQWSLYYHLLISFIYLFFHLTSFAIFTSLLKRNIFIANIKFIDKSIKSINKCRVLKVNNDNIRVLVKNRVLVISKDKILQIERLKIEIDQNVN
ncbi:hypothetical protein EOL94_03455 [bacterium]|nr:hypothetical protein [bacterium]